MSDDTQAVSGLVRGLQEIEAKLQCALPASDAGVCGQLPLADLCSLKAAIERVRPVLLLYIARTSQPQSTARVPSAISTVSSLIEDAFLISDRYLRPKHLRQRAQLRLVDNGK